MVRGRIKAIIWGVLLIATAAFAIFTGMGYMESLDPLKVIFAGVFGGIIITSLIDLNFFGVFFPASLICIIFDAELGMENLTPWPIIGIAVLLSIGFSLIFKVRKPKFGNDGYHGSMVENASDDEIVNLNAKFNGINQYIHSKNLKQVNVTCHFGAVELFFDDAVLSPDGASVNLDVAFGGVDIFVPKDWKVVNYAQASFGGVDMRKNANVMEDAPTLYINGKVAFGGVDIKYV